MDDRRVLINQIVRSCCTKIQTNYKQNVKFFFYILQGGYLKLLSEHSEKISYQIRLHAFGICVKVSKYGRHGRVM